MEPGGWQRPFLTLRESFREHAAVQFEFHLELHGYTRPGPFGKGGEEIAQMRQHAEAFGRLVNTHDALLIAIGNGLNAGQLDRPDGDRAAVRHPLPGLG